MNSCSKTVVHVHVYCIFNIFSMYYLYSKIDDVR